MRQLIAIAALVALPAAATAQMTGEEFDAYTRGKTLYYNDGGQPYGVEEYLDDRKVRWSFLDGECKKGRWYEAEGGEICFVYEDGGGPQCWTFRRTDGGLAARFASDPGTIELYEARQSDEPMQCLGPRIGV